MQMRTQIFKYTLIFAVLILLLYYILFTLKKSFKLNLLSFCIKIYKFKLGWKKKN